MLTARTVTLDRPMAKKKAKATLYVDIPKELKDRIDRLAEARHRKLTAEVAIALERYLDEEEPKEGLSGKPVED
jgi:plasmid maintenance system antidote protein VapI